MGRRDGIKKKPLAKKRNHTVVYCGTRDVYHMMSASAKSLLYHASVDIDTIYFIIEDDTFPEPLPPCIRCVNVSNQTFFPPDGPNYNSRWTYMVLMRAALPKLLPDVDVVLSLDVDTLIRDRIDGIWDIPINHSYFAASQETRNDRDPSKPYYNFGVVLMNLDMFRKNHMDDAVIHALNTVRYHFNEQDCMNELCAGYIAQLPSLYNACAMTDAAQHEHIQHFAGTTVAKLEFNKYSKFYHSLSWNEAYNNLSKCILHSLPDSLDLSHSPRIVVYMGARNYYDYLVKASKSLLFHNHNIDHVYFLIEDDSFPEPLPDIISTINVSNQTFFRPDGPNVTDFYTYITLMRAALSKVFPNYDRVLLLDPDTVVTDDISDIWNTDISDYYLAAVRETRNNNHDKPVYFNAGVMLLNLLKLRSDGMDDKIIREINLTPYEHLEQDVINFLCDGHILELDSCYSASFVTNPSPNPKISHYLSYSKQLFHSNVRKYANLSWQQILS